MFEQNLKEMAATKVPEVRDITRIERIGKLFSIFVDVNETVLLFHICVGLLTGLQELEILVHVFSCT